MQEFLPEILFGVSSLGFMGVFFLLKKCLNSGIELIKFSINLYIKYKDLIMKIPKNSEVKTDIKMFLKKADDFTESLAGILGKIKIIPKKYIHQLRVLIKESDYKKL